MFGAGLRLVDCLHLVQLDLAKGEGQTAEYKTRNPMGKVPTLTDGDLVLWESPAILVYLATKYGRGTLLPLDPAGLGEALRWMFWNASHLEVAIFRVGFEVWAKPSFYRLPPDPAQVAEGTKDFERFAPVLDVHLEKRAWILDSFSVADIAVGTSLEMGTKVGLELSPYPHIGRWFRRLTARPSWKS